LQSDKEVALAVLPLSWSSSSQGIIWKLAPTATVGMALNSGTQRLKEAQIETAFLDAQVILAHVLGVDRPWLFAHPEVELTARQSDQFTERIARCVAREPVAYLVGRKEFYGLDLQVDSRVLIPRPETEMLVDEVLCEIEARGGDSTSSPVRVADVGTGSGAIALAIATHSEAARVYAVDLSRKALAVARSNCRRLDVRKQVTLLHGNLLEPLPEMVEIIVANLPYIGSAEYTQLDPTVRAYEPRLALESGEQGLDAIERLLQTAHRHLVPGGMIYLEIGWQQGTSVVEMVHRLLPSAGAVEVHQDYQGHDRMVAIAL
jgi:release factor glutamine methyltransferase